MCLTRGEAEEDFKFGFQAIVDGLVKIEAEDCFNPAVLVCDAATAISNAAKAVFGPDILIRMCFYHFITCVTKKTKGKPYFAQLKRDLLALHLAPDHDTFEAMILKFFDKYYAIDDDFAVYFKVSLYFNNFLLNY